MAGPAALLLIVALGTAAAQVGSVQPSLLLLSPFCRLSVWHIQGTMPERALEGTLEGSRQARGLRETASSNLCGPLTQSTPLIRPAGCPARGPDHCAGERPPCDRRPLVKYTRSCAATQHLQMAF